MNRQLRRNSAHVCGLRRIRVCARIWLRWRQSWKHSESANAAPLCEWVKWMREMSGWHQAHNRICVSKVSDTFAFTWIRFRQLDSVVGTRINFSGDVHAIPADVEQFVWKNEAKIRRWSVCVCVWICMLEIVAANRCLFSLAQIVRERNESTGNQLCCVQAEPRRRVALRFDCWENGIFVYLLALHKSYTYERFWRFRKAHSRNLLSLIKFGRTRWAWVHRRIHPKYRSGIAYTL